MNTKMNQQAVADHKAQFEADFEAEVAAHQEQEQQDFETFAQDFQDWFVATH